MSFSLPMNFVILVPSQLKEDRLVGGSFLSDMGMYLENNNLYYIKNYNKEL